MTKSYKKAEPSNRYKNYKKYSPDDDISTFGYRSSEWCKGALVLGFFGGCASVFNSIIGGFLSILSFICFSMMVISFLKAIEKIADCNTQD